MQLFFKRLAMKGQVGKIITAIDINVSNRYQAF